MIISILSLTTMGLLTSFHVSHEWSSYALKRKLLRVTHPEGMQRSKYSVSMPLRYGLPFTGAFILLHFFVSEAIFVVQSITYGGGNGLALRPWTPNSQGSITTGYSPVATMTSESSQGC